MMKSILLTYAIGFLLWAGVLWFDSWLQIPFLMLMVGGLVFARYRAIRELRRGKVLAGAADWTDSVCDRPGGDGDARSPPYGLESSR